MLQVLINGIVLGSVYALIALGLTMVFSIMRVVNFAHGQMYMLGAFVVYYLYGQFQLPFWLALPLAGLALAVVGVLFNRLFFQPVLASAKREENSMLMAVGTALLLENLALTLFGEKQRGVPPVVDGSFIFGDISEGGAILTYPNAMVAALSVTAIAALLLFVQYTRPGRALRAVAQDKEAARLQGVDVKSITTLGFAIGAALAGLAGGLLVTIYGVNSGIGSNISTKAFIMIMIGGAGVTSGAIVGGVLLGFAEAIGYDLLPGSLTYLLIFVAMIVFLVFKPNGLFGKPWG
ncbi:branched-chain amino acid ABC transporter permease [Paludibacterium yongneupense]|uniref:branched-chain amino acid ABC transporter permease n=1 Tax=Paludibacterium yongneupense TaxID=400061 RepID=UPI0004248391|nr:branched-chain amino acid ABC transporter permease [Paludibacterium yongneupense]